MNYINDLVKTFWKYQALRFPDLLNYFDKENKNTGRPPVFLKSKEWMNVLLNSNASEDEKNKTLHMILPEKRHLWFASMKSSQALAQSILGNLAVYSKLDYLNEINDEEYNEALLSSASTLSIDFSLEHEVISFEEPRRTSLDAFIKGDYQIAIECKLAEIDVGNCSRPKLTEKDSNYFTDHCDGSYTFQKNRNDRCSLTGIGVTYWEYIPKLFNWKSNVDLIPCPLNHNYQLVRNILSACIRPDGIIAEDNGHALLIYDEEILLFNNLEKVLSLIWKLKDH